MTEPSDNDLLESYARQRSEDAFRELVTRHFDYVYSAAVRLLRDPHQAQDATQAAFVALAEKAGRLPRGTVIAGWLHRAVTFASLKLQRGEARRQRWESEAAVMNAPDEHGPPLGHDALRHVDAAIAELGGVDRDAVVLRFYCNQGFREVAAALGTSEDAAKKRVTRALEKLRRRLVKRGVAVSSTALMAGLSRMPVTAAPPGLPATVAALAGKAGAANAVALTAATKLKLALLATGVIAAGLLLLQLRPPRVAMAPTNSTNIVQASSAMKIILTSVMVNDQDRALRFYTEILGFVKKTELAVPGENARWLTVAAPGEPTGPELLLEPMGFAPARTFQKALFDAGIPLTAFPIGDVRGKYEEMTNGGVVFSTKPAKQGPVTVAVFEDTWGNRIQLFQVTGDTNATTPLTPRIQLSSLMVDD
ncbi:MAG TPA: sigma-70 family RNA polymerase sigma factor [Methylomirabilota bacterium]|nr:sigma-70 family RNA polymerase sigma factor [Methylomirabilota bacterium]